MKRPPILPTVILPALLAALSSAAETPATKAAAPAKPAAPATAPAKPKPKPKATTDPTCVHPGLPAGGAQGPRQEGMSAPQSAQHGTLNPHHPTPPGDSWAGGLEKEIPMSVTWLGATIRGIEGEEFSAFGTVKEDGGVYLVQVPADSPAVRAGLAEGGLVQALDGQETKTAADLLNPYRFAPAAAVRLTVVRSQKETTVVAPAP